MYRQWLYGPWGCLEQCPTWEADAKKIAPSIHELPYFKNNFINVCGLLGLCPWDSPGKNTGVDCHGLLQGIFPTQGSNLGLLHCVLCSNNWRRWVCSYIQGYAVKTEGMLDFVRASLLLTWLPQPFSLLYCFGKFENQGRGRHSWTSS